MGLVDEHIAKYWTKVRRMSSDKERTGLFGLGYPLKKPENGPPWHQTAK